MNTFLESSTEIRKETSVEEHLNTLTEKKWELGFLKRKCRNLELEQFYEAYMQRLRMSHLCLFIYIVAIVMFAHSMILIFYVSALEGSNFYVDVCVYLSSAVLIWIILSFNFREKLIQQFPWIMFLTSWIAVTVLVVADIGIPVYRAMLNHDIIHPAYYSFILYSIYIFMPLTNNLHAFILGMAVTTSYMVTYSFVTYRQHADGTKELDISKVISEAIFFLSVNILGIYFRMMREVAIRTTFLDRRQCVEENLLLRYARDQEKNLLLSIIPAQIANKIETDVKGRIEHMKMKNMQRKIRIGYASSDPPQIEKLWRQPDTEKLFIEPHNDVTILYADVVNYTYLTTQLDVKTLVETIHDLFVKFDTASEEHDVLRIKFLGDCYYCVSGVPIPNEFHARCCVLLGLRMIKDIRDVRKKRKLDIDMRIGVHSGNILSGVIGASKWQFDIWSKDVDIANRLEATGLAGRVHVSEQTLKLLDGEFLYEEGTPRAREDEVLRKYHIRTFLIKPPNSKIGLQLDLRLEGSTSSVRRKIERNNKVDLNTNFMQNTIVQYNQIRNQAKLEMSRELDKMPTGRIQFSKLIFGGQSKRLTQDEMEEQSFRSNISSVFLFFKDWRWEFMYMKEPDVMLKYSTFFGLVTFLAIIGMQSINEVQSSTFWYVVSFDIVLMLLFLVMAWYKKCWIMFISDADVPRPKNKYSLMMYNISDRIQGSILMRIVIYLFMVKTLCTGALLQMLDCDRFQVENEEIEIQLFEDGARGDLCFNPWAVTESLLLTLCMVFLFTRIPFVLKLAVALIIFCIYFIIVMFEFDFIYEKSLTTNMGLYPEISHTLLMFITLCIFHLMDRKTEFISKVDYNWKRQLNKRQDDARFTNETITILINNILPSHVADIYMSKRMKNELYYEEYDNVAVMFATIRNYDTEQVGMRVLNEIICDFDEILSLYKGPMKVEKIKVAGWTYMAACGLDPTRSENFNTQNRNSTLMPNGRRSHYNSSTSKNNLGRSDSEPSTSRATSLTKQPEYEGHQNNSKTKISSDNQNDVVFVMVQFALDLMRTMHSFNIENLQCEDDGRDRGMLRIGISSGPIMAGVVGSYKPHYDIWGNAVNMASRMDSTGIPGCIQVTEETSKILESYNIRCTYRGLTYVKGRGEIPTYFINVDDGLNFVKINE